MEEVFFSKLKASAIIPTKRKEDAGYDIYACIDDEFVIFEPHETKMIPTGIASACPPRYYFQLQERGSTGTKGISQRCGVIDSGYRGEWFVSLTNLNSIPLCMKKPEAILPFDTLSWNGIIYDLGKAIAQAVLIPVPDVEVREISYEELCSMKSERMTGRIGSSQK